VPLDFMPQAFRCLASVLVLGVILSAATVSAQEPAGEQKPPVWQPSASRSVELFPPGDIFPVYAADQQHPTNMLATNFYVRSRIPQSRSPRTTLAGGGRFGMLRIESKTPNGRSWQISLDAGLDAMFDSQNKNDGIGWDGNYGLTVTTVKASSPFGFKVGVLHTSAHLGDEYEERTQTPRINYTREEVAPAMSWQPLKSTRVYGEVGIAYRMRYERQERLRWEAGAEYERPPTVFGGRMAWYGAVDFSAMEERDWRLDTALQGGLVTRTRGRTYRMYVQWYDGRPTIAQFTWYSEAAFSLGLKLDL
jgi:hypothetical protein